jgi:hypothetical protein
MRSSILARILGFRQRIIPEPRVPSRGSQAQGTRLPAMLDFLACRSQALRRAWSAMVILRHAWPPPLVHSTSHRLLSPFSKTHSSVNLQGGCPSIHPEHLGPSNRSRGRLIQPSILLPSNPPRLRMVRLGVQQLNSNGQVYLTLFLRSCLITRGHVPPVQLSPHSCLITPWWWAPVSTPFPTNWLRQ